MKVRKFFEASAGEGSGGSDVVIGKTFNLGEMVEEVPAPAKEETAPTPAETPEEVKPEAVAATEGVKEEVKAGVTEPENKAVEQEAAKEETAPATLQEVLKGKGRREVLEALGIDNVFIDMLDYHQSTGDLKGFLDVKTKDWDSVSDLEIMKDNLRKEYGDLSDKQFEKIFKAEVLDRFAISEDEDDYDEDSRELGQIRLGREAKKIREQYKAEQAGFKIPEPKQPEDALKLTELEAKAKADYEAYANEVNTNEATKGLLKSNKITLGDGDKAYNYEVDSKAVVDSILDTNKLFANCINPDGSYNFSKAFKLANYAMNMDKIEQALIDHGMSLSNKELLETHVNPEKSGSNPAAPVTKSLAQTMATEGRHTTLGSILG